MSEPTRSATADPANTSTSEAAAEAITAQLKNLDPRHVGAAMSKLISASIGDICVVMSKSPAYKFHTLADIEWLVMPAVMSGQFYVGAYASVERGHTVPASVITWARVSDDVDLRLAAGGQAGKRLKPDEWSSGENYWLIDAVGDHAVVGAALVDLSKADLAGKDVKFTPRTHGMNPRAVVLLEELIRVPSLLKQGASDGTG